MEGEIKEKPALNIDLLCKIQGLKGFVWNTKAHERSLQTARETTWPARHIVEHCLLFSHLILYTVECVLGRWDTRQLFMRDSSVQFWVMWSPLLRQVVKPLTYLRQNLRYATRFTLNRMRNNTSVKIVSSRLEQLYRLIPYIWHVFRFVLSKMHFSVLDVSYACMINVWIYIKLLTQTKQSWFCMLFLVWFNFIVSFSLA